MTREAPRRAGRSAPAALAVFAAAALVAVAACSGTTAPTAPSALPVAAVAGATAANAPTSVPAASPARPLVTATAVPTSLDPCNLFTSAEASQLTGVSFGAGVRSTTSGNAVMCTYGAQTTNVFHVGVAVAPDVATAQAERAQGLADAAKADPAIQVTQLPTLGDGGAMAQASGDIGGQTISVIGVYDLKGTVFFTINDLAVGGNAPSASAMQAAAVTVLSRLP